MDFCTDMCTMRLAHGEAAPRNLELEAHRGHIIATRLLLVCVDVEGRVVGRRVDAYTSTTLISSSPKGRVPGQRSLGRASDGLPFGDRARTTERRIDAVEDLAVEVGFFGRRRVVRESMFRNSELVVRHLRIRMVPERVDPPVAHTVGKLLLLPPQNLVRQKRVVRRVEGLPQ